MTKDEKKRARERVAIAKDALEWLKAGALVARQYVYVLPQKEPASKDARKQLRDIVLGPCQACALGALFLAKAVRFNDVTVGDYVQSDDDGAMCRNNLYSYFSNQQMGMIESAFEMSPTYAGRVGVNGMPSVDFGRQYASSKLRLTAILENIIANGGEFRP